MWKAVLQIIAVLTTGAVGIDGGTREITDEEYALFPRLFHLDDYDSCMLKDDALYCLGVFQITGSTSPALQLVKTYSEDVHNFNRTRLHRGYCVSERCPLSPNTSYDQCFYTHLDIGTNNSIPHTSNVGAPVPHKYEEAKNTSCGFHNNYQDSKFGNVLRFERCVSKYARKQNFEIQLNSLQYCHTKQDLKKDWKIETPHLVFLWMVGMVLVMNLLGTVYDETRSGAKSRLLTSWSIRRNWQHLMGNFSEGDPRLSTLLPTEGFRCLLLLLVLLVHSGCIQNQLYLGNPRLIEWYSHQPFMKIFHNGQSVVQLFSMMSSFLLAQGVLQATTRPSFWILPKFLIKRIFRIAPVYLLSLGYAATWWPRTRGGPQWPALVEAESAVCRHKFWLHAFFVGNFVRDNEMCLLQTWYLEVDIQLYAFALVLIVLLSRVRRWALVILAGLFLAACGATAALAYVAGWEPLMMVSGPENIRSLFSSVEQFRALCTKPWGNVGACLTGLFLAHLHHQLQESGFDPQKHKWLIISCQLAIPLLPCWTCGAGHLFRDMSSRGARAVFLALERPVMAVLAGVVLFGIYNGKRLSKIDNDSATSAPTKGYMKPGWWSRALYPLGRMSMSVVMTHWLVNKTFAASRHGLYYTSALDMVVDFLATACLCYTLALPVTLLLDIPMQQFFRAVTS